MDDVSVCTTPAPPIHMLKPPIGRQQEVGPLGGDQIMRVEPLWGIGTPIKRDTRAYFLLLLSTM